MTDLKKQEMIKKTNIKVDLIEQSQERMEKRQTVFHKDISSKYDDLQKSHSLLSFHLIGDPQAGTKGWIYKFDRFAGRLTNIERALVVMSGLIATGIVKAITSLY